MKRNRKHLIIIFLSILIGVLILATSCRKEDPPPPEPNVCDTTKFPPPHYGTKNGQCLPSCGVLGGSNEPSKCTDHGLVSAGQSYDVEYCCKPPAPPRWTLQELRTRQMYAAARVAFPPHNVQTYIWPRMAARIVRGGPSAPFANFKAGYWTTTMPYYLAQNGRLADAKAYFKKWLKCEAGSYDATICELVGNKNWRYRSSYCSLNHQIGRHFGVYAAVDVLGEAEALKHGDPYMVRNAKKHLMDVLTGKAWFGAGGFRTETGPCGGNNRSLGDHPEGYRSRHYAPRVWMHTWAAADLASDKEVRDQAGIELDKMVASMEPGVRADGLWDEKILPHFRANTGTRCPQYCPGMQQSFGLTCHPGDTQVLSYILFSGKAWRPEFSNGGAPCGPYDTFEHWHDYIYLGGKYWTPLK